MKITIDTQFDKIEDIQKVLHLLHSVLEQKEQSSQPVDTTPLMGMFSNDEPSNNPQSSGTAPDFNSFLQLTKSQEKKDSLPKIQLY